MAKGSEFEREICKLLSRWWSDGKRDDIFWRSSQSGGRATQRAKTGQKTFGSYGDMTAVDPIGAPLLKYFTIELKRGRSHGFLGDLLDIKGDNSKHPFTQCLHQARRSAKLAGSKTWLLICRRDRRAAMAYLPWKQAELLMPLMINIITPCYLCHLPRGAWVAGLPLETFLDSVRPKQIIDCVKEL
jgi:hypothetical protein